MPRVKTTIPEAPFREKGQRSLDDSWIYRRVAPWTYPEWQTADFWRSFVRAVPAALTSRETLISYMTSLTWKIEPRDSQRRDELKSSIEYHTDLFENGGYFDVSGWDFIKLIEWVLTDTLDIPFGGSVETIREGDKAGGRVLRIVPIDGATLYPTRDKNWPVFQRIEFNPIQTVVFPAHAINRIYLSPRTEIRREGWGMAPPEKIYLAIEMLRRGDTYYAKTLLDTPEAGILDLMDMEESAALDWIRGFKELYTGIDSMKIPVLYEHTQQAKWIPFGKPPTDLMFDRIYHQYTALVCSGYGLTPTDIGMPSIGGGGGQTLAGSIRDERRTRRSGIARLKDSTRYFFNRMLPPDLHFVWIDLDDEYSIALSRARLANATAMNQYIQSRVFTEKEARLQTLADGLFTIGVPEDIPEDEFISQPGNNIPSERPGMLGSPVKPSFGGHGEITPRSCFDELLLSKFDISDIQIRKLSKAIIPVMKNELEGVLNTLEPKDVYGWLEWHTKALWGEIGDLPEITLSSIQNSSSAIDFVANEEGWLSLSTTDVTKIVNDLVKLYSQEREKSVLDERVLDYENGKSKNLSVKVDPNPELEKKFRSESRKLVQNFVADISIAKGVIAGVRNAVIRIGLVEFDKNQEYDNINLIMEVRNELAKHYHRYISDFYYRVNDLIQNYLEKE